MVVTTSRRTYQIKLQSDSHRYMARVGFDYPEDIQAKFEAANRQLETSIIPGAGVPAENLDFKFNIHGQARWRPTRVYSDGLKTYIQFPNGMASGDAPVLYITAGGQNQIVNYRLKGSLMIVDYMIDQAVLVSGVGYSQQKSVSTGEGDHVVHAPLNFESHQHFGPRNSDGWLHDITKRLVQPNNKH